MSPFWQVECLRLIWMRESYPEIEAKVQGANLGHEAACLTVPEIQLSAPSTIRADHIEVYYLPSYSRNLTRTNTYTTPSSKISPSTGSRIDKSQLEAKVSIKMGCWLTEYLAWGMSF